MILLGSQRQLSKIHSDYLDSVLLNGVPIPFADSVKNLGVSMDKLLSGDLWVKQTCQKAFALIHRFYRCAGLWFPTNARRALVNALVLLLLDYGAILHSGLSATNKRKLQPVRNCCMRFIYALRRGEPIAHLYVENDCLQLTIRRQ